MAERRYNEEETAAIFMKAAEGAEAPTPPVTREEGLTLGDLQEIGREVGIAPAAVAAAASAVERTAPAAARSILGLPLGVERAIDLPRKLTESEWEHLVVDLRDSFHARGTVSEHGSFRQWTNGNLQALLEPTARGHRLRLRTLKGNARPFVGAGLATLGITAVMIATSAVAGDLMRSLPSLVFVSALGVGMLGYALIPLRGWARRRIAQMEAVIARLAPVAEAPPELPPG